MAENFWESSKIEIETQEARPPGGLSYFWPKKEPMPARAAAQQLRLHPQPANIAYSNEAFQELLQIRYSSKPFRTPAFTEVEQNLTFLNTGQSQTPVSSS